MCAYIIGGAFSSLSLLARRWYRIPTKRYRPRQFVRYYQKQKTPRQKLGGVVGDPRSVRRGAEIRLHFPPMCAGRVFHATGSYPANPTYALSDGRVKIVLRAIPSRLPRTVGRDIPPPPHPKYPKEDAKSTPPDSICRLRPVGNSHAAVTKCGESLSGYLGPFRCIFSLR